MNKLQEFMEKHGIEFVFCDDTKNSVSDKKKTVSKSILISIRPKWVSKILNGEKTIEIRKTAPKCELPIDVYIYETKDQTPLVFSVDYPIELAEKVCNSRGKVIAKFTLRKVELIYWGQDCMGNPYINDECVLMTDSLDYYELEHKSCLKEDELDDYIGYELDNYGYAWHISDLVIFDKPKELVEFKQSKLPNPKRLKFATWKANYYWALGDYCNKHKQMMVREARMAFDELIAIKKAPRSLQYVEVLE